MPKCKECPIVKECQKMPLFTAQPTEWDNEGKPIKGIRSRLCPLLVMLGSMGRQFGVQEKKP